MNKLYNNEMVVVKGLSDFFENIGFKLSKPQAKNSSSYYNFDNKCRKCYYFRHF